jgi:L-threonylcarbamoyladenylate synthase
MSAQPGPLVFEIDPDRLGGEARAGVEAAARALARGELVVLPTETVYGLAARPDLPDAAARVFEAKRRPRGLSLPVLAADATTAWTVARRTPIADALAAAFWPGPLTLVLPRSDTARSWQLGEDPGSVAVRVPDHRLSQALLHRSGPLATTSANPSGDEPLATAEDLLEAFAGHATVFLVLAPGAPPPLGRASTVVDARGDEMTVLRPGALDEGALAAAFALPAGGRPRRNDVAGAMGRLPQ